MGVLLSVKTYYWHYSIVPFRCSLCSLVKQCCTISYCEFPFIFATRLWRTNVLVLSTQYQCPAIYHKFPFDLHHQKISSSGRTTILQFGLKSFGFRRKTSSDSSP
mmetsp:Transcript_30195/g.39793  ORF Transcript_30195/g.39793 Transcript_30195/m.39793 type:complete len:105 (-) Transcript_30195:459-773(-)